MSNVLKHGLSITKKLFILLLLSVGLSIPLVVIVVVGLFFFPPYPLPPGYTDIFPSRDWSVPVIEELIDRPFPTSAQDITFDGTIGTLGSYGITPSLEFLFRASPEDATAFAYSFCEGVLHQGYDPFNALDSEFPSSGDILISGDRFLYYSSSPNVNLNIAGNRCIRVDGRNPNRFGNPYIWFEEIALELYESESLATVRYRLPYEPNGYSAPVLYPVGYNVNPLDDQFSVYVSGIFDIKLYQLSLPLIGIAISNSESVGATFVQTYPIMCFSSRGWVHTQYDRFWNAELLLPYQQAELSIFIDDVLLLNTTLNERGVMFDPTYQEFCFDTTWGAGLHTVRLDVQRADGVRESFDWQFFTPEDIAGV
jgi:hypothetical protein